MQRTGTDEKLIQISNTLDDVTISTTLLLRVLMIYLRLTCYRRIWREEVTWSSRPYVWR